MQASALRSGTVAGNHTQTRVLFVPNTLTSCNGFDGMESTHRAASVLKEPMTQYGRKSIKMGLFYIYIHTSDFGAELRSNNATQGAKPG